MTGNAGRRRTRIWPGSAPRVLGLAFRELPKDYTDADFDRELTFVGLVGMTDPLRDEAKATITTCREAGIRTVMITGDQQITAAEIARQLELDLDPKGQPLKTVHGRELADLDAEGWKSNRGCDSRLRPRVAGTSSKSSTHFSNRATWSR